MNGPWRSREWPCALPSAETQRRWRTAVSFWFAVLVVTMLSSSAPGAEFRAVAEYRDSFYADFPIELIFALSANGQVIVSDSPNAAPGDRQAWRWSSSTGLEWLPFPVPQQANWRGCEARAVTGDGSRIFVACQVDHEDCCNNLVRPFLYEEGSFTPWPRLNDSSYPADVTPDGRIVVGTDLEGHWYSDFFQLHAVQWDNGAIGELAELSAGSCAYFNDDDATAVAVSDDGGVIVGHSGEQQDYTRPCVWINGVPGRLDLTGPECGIETYNFNVIKFVWDLSGNGEIAVGQWPTGPYAYPAPPPVPLYWNVQTRAHTLLPYFSGEHTEGAAYCTNRDGSWIGGRSGNLAVIWNRSTGQLEDVRNVLQRAGLAPATAGWEFNSVYRMSGDAKQIAGFGIHPNGQQWIWWADLRDPPANDNCGNAKYIGQPPFALYTHLASEAGSLREASMDGASPCRNFSGKNVDAWYSYSAPVDGFLYLDLCGSSLQNPFLSVHRGCEGTSADMVFCSNSCSEASCGGPCIQPPYVRLTAGQTYYIAVGAAESGTGDFTLHHQFLPLNDGCESAVLIRTVPSGTPGTTMTMSADNVGTCQDVTQTAAGVWYKVVGTGTVMTASTCGRADFDTQISVYCSGCGGMHCVAANDDSECRPQSSVSWCSLPGMVYHILVHGYGNETGTFWLDVSKDSTTCQFARACNPANDTCEDAVALPKGTTLTDNTGSNTSAPLASCAVTTNDIWYSYAAACDGQTWIDTCQAQGSLADSVISVYDACDGQELDCSDDYQDETINCGSRSAAVVPAGRDQELLIRVAGYGLVGTNQGTFPLRITEVPEPLWVYAGPLPTAVERAYYSTRMPYSGGCGWPIVRATSVPPGLDYDSYSKVLRGEPLSSGDYVIHLEVVSRDIANPEFAEGDFTLRVLPANDNCANALPVSEGHYMFGNVGAATDGPGEPALCTFAGESTIESDLWYRYTSSCEGKATVDLCASDYNTKLAVYPSSDCPISPGALACNDDACGTQSQLSFSVHPTDYLIRVGGYRDAQGNGQMVITCFNDCNGNDQSDAKEIATRAQLDCNSNLRPDECDRPADANGDLDINAMDLPFWLECLRGPCGSPPCTPPLYTHSCCTMFDMDSDGDVDLQDVHNWMQILGGPEGSY